MLEMVALPLTEVLGAQVTIGLARGEQVINDDEDGVADRN